MTVDFSQLEQQNGLPSGLLSAMQQQESGGNQNAVSPKGAVGAFQFMPQTAQAYGIDPTDPDQSAQAAAQMMGGLVKKYNGDIPSALAGYNWGQGNLDRHGMQNAPPETQNYIQKIMSGIGNAIVPSAQAAEAPQGLPPGFVMDKPQAATSQNVPHGFVLDKNPEQQMVAADSQEMGPLGPKLFGIPNTQGVGPQLESYGLNSLQAIPFSDEAISGIGSAFGGGNGQDFGSRYADLQQRQQAMREAGRQVNPGANMLGTISTGLALAPLFPSPTEAATTLGAIGKGAATGAAYGGGIGLGQGNAFQTGQGSADTRIQNAEQGAKWGGLLGGALPAAGAALGASANMGKTMLTGAGARDSEDLAQSVTDMKSAANPSYAQSKGTGAEGTTGATFKDDASQDIVNAVEQRIGSTGLNNARLHGDTLSVLDDMKNAAANGDMTVEQLDQYRQLFRDVVDKNTDGIRGMNPDAFKAQQAIKAIDEQLDNVTVSDLSNGSLDAIKSLQTGRQQYAQAARFNQVANVIKQAGGDPNRIKAGLQRFVNKPGNLRGFSAEEQAALRDAAANTTSEKLLKMVGKFGIDLGTSLTPGNTALPALTGFLGGTPLVAAGTMVRQAQKYMARGKAEKALQLIQGMQ